MADINSSVRYAASGSPGIFADSIGWFDYSGLPGDGSFTNNTTYSVSNIISRPSGYKITFDLTINQTFEDGGAYTGVAPLQPPVYPFSVFGNTAYIGISGKVDIYMSNQANVPTTTIITLDNIQVLDSNNYTSIKL